MRPFSFLQKIIFTGFIIWLFLLILYFITWYHEEWARLILALAALVWMPLALPHISTKRLILEQLLYYLLLPSAILLSIALFLPIGLLPALLTFPWLLFTILIALRGWFYFWESSNRSIGIIAISAAHVFLVVGGMWTFADRIGWQPLGFDPAIVLLTGIHFHYAGFIFPLLAGLATLQYPSNWLKTGSWLTVIAVPLTAIGITLTQLFSYSFLEILAAVIVTLAGWSIAIGYLDFIIRKQVKGLPRLLWTVLSFALLASMILAFLYAIRYWFLIEWLTIPAMRALHGSLNAIVVSGCGLLGWQLYRFNLNDKY